MNNLGGNTDNIHLGDTKVLGDLEVRDDLIIDGEITITPPDCLNVDCIKPSTLNGDVSIKNSNEDTIIKLSNDESVEISGSYKLPTTAGTEGQLLTADAGGLTTSFQDQALPLVPSQEIGYIAIANTSYNTSRTLIWSSLGGTNQFSTDVLGTGGYVEFKSIGKIYTRRTQDGIISDTYRLEVDVVQTGGYVDTSTFTWSISDNVFVLDKDVDYERDYEFRFTIQKMNDNSFTIFGSGTATQLVNPTGTIQLPVQKIQFQDVKDSDSHLLFTDVATDVKLNVYFTAVQDPGVISSFVPFSGQFHAHQLGFLPEVVLNTSDHSALSNLSLGDSHTQYSLSNGRFGGQTLTGGTSITDKLVLQSNSSDPLDGHVELKSFIDMQNNQIINVSIAGGIGQLVDTNTTNNTGSVAVHSDVSSAGSGIIISSGERTAIGTNTTNNTGSVAVHSDVSSAGSGIIISSGERTAISTNTTNNTGSVAVHSDVSSAGSGIIISSGERTAIGTNTTNNTGSVAVHSDVSSAGSGIIISSGERTAIGTNTTNNTGSVAVHSDVSSAGSGVIISVAERTAIGTNTTALTGKVDKSGDTMTGELKMSSQIISGVANPISDQDVATKAYVDTATDDVVIGPASTTDNRLCIYDGNTGKLVKDSLLVALGGSLDSVGLAPFSIGGATAIRVDLGSTTTETKILGGLDMFSKKITNLLDPTADQDGATKAYVDTATDGVVIGPSSSVSSHLCSFNGTTGKLIKNSGISAIGGNIDQSSGAPLKLGGLTAQSVDIGSATIPTYVFGGLDMSSKKITNLLDPTSDQDGATKKYVDDTVADAYDSSTYTLQGNVVTGTPTIGVRCHKRGNQVTITWDFKAIIPTATGSKIDIDAIPLAFRPSGPKVGVIRVVQNGVSSVGCVQVAPTGILSFSRTIGFLFFDGSGVAGGTRVLSSCSVSYVI